MHLLIWVNSRDTVETTFSAIATCVFKILPARHDAGHPTDIFDAAIEIVVKVEESRRKSSRIALYTAAREYFEWVPTASPKGSPAITTMNDSRAKGDEDRSGKASNSEGVEIFSMAVVVKILEGASIDTDSENIRIARIRMVLAFVRQSPSPSQLISGSATIAARGKISTILKRWRSAERSRPLQKDIDEALEANQQALERTG